MHPAALPSHVARIAVALVAALCLGLLLPQVTTQLTTPTPGHSLVSSPAGATSGVPPGSPAPAATSGALPGSPAPVPSGDSAGTPPPQVLTGVPIPVLTHGPRDQRVVALTFDDGWSPAATQQIFAILQAEHVAATFFPYAGAARRDPAVWRAIAAAGYPIANHTTNHPDLTTLPAWRVRAELDVARTTMAQITGFPLLDLFRPPYGAWNLTVLREAAAAGCRAAVLWDVDSRDWTGIRAAQIAARAEAGRDGSIILLHAGPAQTPLALPAIIGWYRAHGYGFVTIPALLASSLGPLPPPPSTSPSPTP